MGVLSNQFISPIGEKNLLAYRYSGSDASLLYKYFFSPIAQALVDKVIPSWLAPNVITLIGFMCTFIPHIIILCMFPNQIEGPAPKWLCILAAVGQLCYMILDNADGKQARKTGSSSPLGLLFDHGCDAMNTFITGLSVFTVTQLGNTNYTVYAAIIGMITFYIATWEEFYVESLNLPIINGANEGIVIMIAIYIATAIGGTNIWTHSFGPLQANQLVVISFAVMSFVTITSNMVTVYKKDSKRFANAVFNLIAVFYIAFTMWVITSYTDVVSEATNGGTRLVIYIGGFSFAKLVGHLQACHVAHEDFQQFRKSILILTFLNAHTLLAFYLDWKLWEEMDVLIGGLILTLISYTYFVIKIISQFSRVLKIYVFKLGSRDAEEPLV